MANYTVVKPVTVKGNRYPVGMVLPESVFYPGGAARLARVGYVVKANETTGQMNTCLSVLPDETDVDGLGKIALELGSFQLTGTTFSGTAHYVTGYTGFHSDPSEQEGYFLPFGFGMPDGYDKAYMMVKGGSGDSVEPTAQNVIFLGRTAEDARKKMLVITLNQVDGENPHNIQSSVTEYSLEGITFEAQKKARKKE